PKRKVSKARQGERRAHLAISAPPLVECDHCHELKRAHHVCPTCGWYAGREAVAIEPVEPVEGQRYPRCASRLTRWGAIRPPARSSAAPSTTPCPAPMR
ncbi:MAG: 50S ribosomal protein L32, partial [Candidatus Limnocylindria bacterium]